MTILSCKINYRILLLVLTCFLLVKTSFAQTPVGSRPAPVPSQSSELQGFQQQTQNAAALAAQQQRAQDLATASAAAAMGQPMPLISEVEVPEGASQTMGDFLVARAGLMNARAQIHNQVAAQVAGQNLTPDQIAQIEQTEMAQFQQQQQAALQAQQQRAQTLAQESASQPQPMPPPLVIPPDATPQMAAFLTARDQLMRSQIQMQNQYANADPATRQAAMAQWQQQNAAQLQQLQTLAQNLSTSTTN
jgi:hypothetical protein